MFDVNLSLRIGIDVGGTFTDLVAVDEQTGQRIVIKTASTPRAPQEGVLQALDRLFERFPHQPSIRRLAHSSTIATNALLGQMHLELPRVVFVTTHGFRDVVEIGRQNRSEIYNLFVTRPKALAARDDRIGVHERLDYRGNVLVALTDAEVSRVVEEVRARRPQAIAVGLLHSYVNDAHERQLAGALAAALPNVPIACSVQIDAEYREYERFSTALVNAALTPIVQRYIEQLERTLRDRGIGAPLFVMLSNAGLVAASRAGGRAAAMIESGPASGVLAAAQLARAHRIARGLSFDMGGTTAKAGTIIDGAVQVATEFEAAGCTHSGRSVKGSGYPVRFPFVDLAEISAGGGTIAWIDTAGSLRVGPVSAGADPGPACYGLSDRPTVTDANVVLGRLNPRALAGGTFLIDAQRSRDAIAALAQALHRSAPETAAGIVRIVDAQMAKVLRIVTVERGLDPRDFSMIAFGGNGPLHGCALAEELGIRRVIVPSDPGVFSAHGLLEARLREDLVRPILLDTAAMKGAQVAELFADLERVAKTSLLEQGAPDRIEFVREYEARYRGQSFELSVPHAADPAKVARGFHELHKRRYGYDVPEEPVEIVSARLTAIAVTDPLPEPPATKTAQTPSTATEREVWIDGHYRTVPVYRREDLPVESQLEGPALIEFYDSCAYVPPNWVVREYGGSLVLET